MAQKRTTKATTSKATPAVGHDEADLLRRSMAAYFRTGGTDQPATPGDVIEAGGKVYVRLSSVKGTLAVYRVRNDGMLKRMKRWPASLDR